LSQKPNKKIILKERPGINKKYQTKENKGQSKIIRII
jgi:hypothetical protein